MKKNHPKDNQFNPEPQESKTQQGAVAKPKTTQQLEEEAALYLAGWKRAQADYQNLKKETDKLRIESIQFANQALIEKLIPVFDNFALALKHLPEQLANHTWVQGIIYIHKQMQDILAEEGVQIIDPQGEVFDPYLHEAVDSAIQQNDQPPIITEVLQVGYQLKGKLIRSARVKVSS